VPLTVGILLFDEVEVLDFAGPFEVFSVAGRRSQQDLFHVVTVSERGQPVSARNRLLVTPAHSFGSCPPLDIVLIPGGYGTRPLLRNAVALEWIARTSRKANLVLSVCTGSLLLGAAGMLQGLHATTHHLALGELRSVAADCVVEDGARIVDNGRVICSSGVSAGIDMALHVVGKLHGAPVAQETARYMEYDGAWDRPTALWQAT
jgi:transcriptional regulator GlxA family with amidase domain